MRVSYGQEQKAYDHLNDLRIPAFIPKHFQKNKLTGKKELVSAVRNILFVHSTINEMKQYIGSPQLPYLHHIYHSPSQLERLKGYPRRPLVIPDPQMATFIRWFDAKEADKYFRLKAYSFFKGDKVRVIGGSFIGMVGNVVTISGHRRVGLNIDHLGFIATPYIPRELLEPYDVDRTYRRIWLLTVHKQDYSAHSMSMHQTVILHTPSDLRAWCETKGVTIDTLFASPDEITTIFEGNTYCRTYSTDSPDIHLHLSIIPYDVRHEQTEVHILYHFGIISDTLTTILFNDRKEALTRFLRITQQDHPTPDLRWESHTDAGPHACAGIITLQT